MTVIYTTHRSRRSQLTILKIRLNHFRSRLRATRHIEQSLKLKSKSKENIAYVSSWLKKWSLLHFILISICISIYYPSFMQMVNIVNNKDSNESSFLTNNTALIRHKYLNWIHYDWCSSSSSFHNNSSSHAVMIQSVILLSVTCCMVLIIALLIYFTLNENSAKQSAHKSLLFWRDMLTVGLFIGLSIFNQSINSVTCRPVEIMYDERYTLMLVMQMLGFIACLHFAYGLGNIFKPLLDQPRTARLSDVSILSRSESPAPLFSSINNIP